MRYLKCLLLLVASCVTLHAQNARPVLADTNGVIRVGTVGSQLTALNASALTSGTVPTNTLPGLLPSLSIGDGGGLATNLASPSSVFVTNWSSSTLTTNITIPSWARIALLEGVAPGGAGGSGSRRAPGVVSSGGSGGGGGSFARRFMPLSGLHTNIFKISIPSIRTGGGGPTTDDTFGTNGATASSMFVYVGNAVNSNIVLRCLTGFPGIGGDADGSVGGAGGTGGAYAGIDGGASSSTGAAGSASATTPANSGRGGGGGGGIQTSGVPNAGGGGTTGGGFYASTGLSGGAVNGGTVPTYATDANFVIPNLMWYGLIGGPGAPGSGGSTNAPSANGGNGEYPGSGGGGSGATLNGFKPGDGGNGGPGAVAIHFW